MEAIVNQQATFQLDLKNGKYLVNGEEIALDISVESEVQYHLLHEGKSYNVTLHKLDTENREVTLTINGKKAVVKVASQTALLLRSLGLENALKPKIDAVKAPMPGLIHSILVSEGQSVEKGDPLLILEAMKMENIIKAPTSGIIAKIHAQPKTTVDKGAVLMNFG
ncbi:MAG: biotin/lipoyl-containing protein [Bacteroidia bacterium]